MLAIKIIHSEMLKPFVYLQMSGDGKQDSVPLVDTKDLVDDQGLNIQGIKCKDCSSKIIPLKTAKYLEMSEKGESNTVLNYTN